jgi:hypothetical protein
MGPVVVDTRAEEAPVQKKLENGRMQGGKGAWKEALWRAEKDKQYRRLRGLSMPTRVGRLIIFDDTAFMTSWRSI